VQEPDAFVSLELSAMSGSEVYNVNVNQRFVSYKCQ